MLKIANSPLASWQTALIQPSSGHRKFYLQIKFPKNKIPKINWESILIASIKPCFSELRCDLLTLTLKNLLRDIGTSSGGRNTWKSEGIPESPEDILWHVHIHEGVPVVEESPFRWWTTAFQTLLIRVSSITSVPSHCTVSLVSVSTKSVPFLEPCL